MFYAIYLKNGPIYGVGQTIQEAWDDADQWIDTRDGLAVSECSENLFNTVNNDGGAIAYSEKDGVLILRGEENV